MAYLPLYTQAMVTVDYDLCTTTTTTTTATNNTTNTIVFCTFLLWWVLLLLLLLCSPLMDDTNFYYFVIAPAVSRLCYMYLYYITSTVHTVYVNYIVHTYIHSVYIGSQEIFFSDFDHLPVQIKRHY
jgi:hypothetical protein